MRRSIGLQKLTSCMVLAAFSILCIFVAPVQAAMVGTTDVLSAQQKNIERQKVKMFLKRQDVTHQLQAWGVNPEEAMERVDAMTDAEVTALADKIDNLPAGGDVLGFIAIVALITVLVLIILDATGVTDVFTFINKR